MSLKVGDLIPIGGGGYSLLSNVEDLKVDAVGDKFIEISWKDPLDVVVDGITITEWAGTQIRIKKGNYPSNEKDGTLVLDSKIRNQYQNNPYKITGLDNNDEYFIMAFPHTDKNVFTVDSANRISATPQLDDQTDAPGSKNLISGTVQEGYFGIVSASELITGTALASAAGISAGTSQFSDGEWLKFAWKGKIQFVAKKPLRHSISWDAINTAGCVFGSKTVQIGGLTYKVRLMKSGLVDPMPNIAAACHGSEWNRLMLPIHIEAKDKSWASPANVEVDIPYWGIDFTNEDLHTHSTFGSGTYSWCQETNTTNRVARGFYGVSSSGANISSPIPNTIYGWRPVLELVA